ncbi:hypothetical protein U1Q18_023097 [Sarracenia purpurea var. burkii]
MRTTKYRFTIQRYVDTKNTNEEYENEDLSNQIYGGCATARSEEDGGDRRRTAEAAQGANGRGENVAERRSAKPEATMTARGARWRGSPRRETKTRDAVAIVEEGVGGGGGEKLGRREAG